MLGELIGEVAGGFFRAVGRIVAEVFLEIIMEVAVQGVGYLICKPFKPDVKSDGWLATTVGLLFWALVAVLAYVVYGRLRSTGEA
jgi:hypothetical protein